MSKILFILIGISHLQVSLWLHMEKTNYRHSNDTHGKLTEIIIELWERNVFLKFVLGRLRY